jgi:predicted ATP-binding protein involved in virulence
VSSLTNSERATLVAVLDAQRRELALRARAQADAVRAAESFASATQRFEERLAALESRTADELREIRRLLARQAAASDLILRSLGLALPPEPPSAAAEGGKAL